MKKQIMTAFTAILFMLSMSIVDASAAVDPVGTWKYSAPDAPYEYSSGKIIVTKEDGELKGSIKIDYYTISAQDVKLENNTLSFGAYIEGEYIKIKIDLDGDKFAGKATYSEGTLPLSGERVKQ